MIGLMQEPTSGAPADFKKARRQKANLKDPTMEDRLLPHSVEAEQGVLGCILLSPNDCIGLVIEKINDNEAFYDLRHRQIFDCLLSMHNDSVPIDLITVQQELKDLCQLEGVGGLAYLASLPDAVPSAANISYYIEILREKFTLRKGIGAATEFISRAYEHQGEVLDIIEELDSSVREIVDGSQPNGTLASAKDLVKDSINRFEYAFQNQGKLSGLSTGLIDLDVITNGLKNSEMIVIAARPSEGKSAMMMGIADHVAVELRLPVLVFSLEMTAEALIDRAICSRARVSMSNIRGGFLAERDFSKITFATGQLNKSPLYIDDASGTSIMQLRAKARRYHQQYGIRLVCIDFLSCITSSKKRVENRRQEIAEVSNGIKNMAKDLKVPVVVLSQLNRELDKDKKRKPRMSDIRDAGEVEQDADFIGFLYKPDRGEESEVERDVIPVNMLVAKQRNGRTGDIPFSFVRSYTRFESAAKISDSDYQTPYTDQ